MTATPPPGPGRRFTAEILGAGRGGHAVLVPKELAAGLSGRRVPVLAEIDGVEYRSRVAAYGGQVYLGLRAELLRRIGKQAGDTVQVRLTEGAEPEAAAPEPAEPPELLAALAQNEAAGAAYAALPPSHRREYWVWIGEAKDPGTRAERVARMVRRLSS